MILEKLRKTIIKYNLINKKDSIVIGVSGGTDSVALLYLLNSLKSELGLILHIVHLDHMLRADSYKDAEFVRKIAQGLKIPITIEKINVRELAQKGSIEEIARNARLGLFFKVAKDIKAEKIALAHTRDDQAETVLMRIIRGAGLYGLAGILPKRKMGGCCVIRPLIEVRRKEIEAFLRKKKVKPRTDKSNKEDIYFRNKIRNRLLPLLEAGYNHNIKEILSNLALTVGYDYDYMEQIARKITKRLGPKINLEKFLELHPAMQHLVLRLSIAQVKGDTRRITFGHIKEINDLILNRPTYSVVDLPKGVSVVKKKKNFIFFRR